MRDRRLERCNAGSDGRAHLGLVNEPASSPAAIGAAATGPLGSAAGFGW